MDDAQVLSLARAMTGKESISALNIAEADAVKQHLQKEYGEQIPTIKKMMAKAIGTAETALGLTLTHKSPDWLKFNYWMRKKSTAKRMLADCSIKELASVITQLERIAINSVKAKSVKVR